MGPLAFYGIEVTLLQQPEKKFLREVFGIVRCVPAPARECVKWIPIRVAQFFEAGHGLRRRGIAREKYDRPMSRYKCRLPGNLMATFR